MLTKQSRRTFGIYKQLKTFLAPARAIYRTSEAPTGEDHGTLMHSDLDFEAVA